MRIGSKKVCLAAALVASSHQVGASWLFGGWTKAEGGAEQQIATTTTNEVTTGTDLVVPVEVTSTLEQVAIEEPAEVKIDVTVEVKAEPEPSSITDFEVVTTSTEAVVEPVATVSSGGWWFFGGSNTPTAPVVDSNVTPIVESVTSEIREAAVISSVEQIAEPVVTSTAEATEDTSAQQAQAGWFAGWWGKPAEPELTVDDFEVLERKEPVATEVKPVIDSVPIESKPVIVITSETVVDPVVENIPSSIPSPMVSTPSKTLKRKGHVRKERKSKKLATVEGEADRTPIVYYGRSKHFSLPKTARLADVSALFHRLTTDPVFSRYHISQIPERLIAFGGIKELAEAYGFKILEENSRSILIERRKMGRSMITRLAVDELVREDERRCEAELFARVNDVHVNTLEVTEEQTENDFPVTKKVVPVYAPKDIPHSQKNIHRTKWWKPAKTADVTREQKKVALVNEHWDDQPHSISEDEIMDFNDNNIDWDHYIEPVEDDYYTEESEEEEQAPRKTRRQSLAPTPRPHKAPKVGSPAQALKSADRLMAYQKRRSDERAKLSNGREKSPRMYVAEEKKAANDEIKAVMKDDMWRELLEDRFGFNADKSSVSYEDYDFDYNTHSGEFLYSSWDDYEIPFAESSQESMDIPRLFTQEESSSEDPMDMPELFSFNSKPKPVYDTVPFDMVKFFAGDLAAKYTPPEDNPFDINDLFYPAEEKKAKKRNPHYGNKKAKGTQENQPRGIAGRGRGRGQHVPRYNNNSRTKSGQQWVPKDRK